MATVPALATVQSSQTDEPPPRRLTATACAFGLIFAGLLPGFMLGIATAHSPPVQLCQGAADPIACLIISLD